MEAPRWSLSIVQYTINVQGIIHVITYLPTYFLLTHKQNDLRCPGCDLPVVMEDDNSEAKYSNDVVDGQFDSDSIDDDASKFYIC